MALNPDATIGTGTDISSGTTWTLHIPNPVKAGERVVLAIAGNNSTLNNPVVSGVSGGPTTWSVYTTRGANQQRGVANLIVSEVFPSNVPSMDLTVTMSATANQKIWLARSYTGFSAGFLMDVAQLNGQGLTTAPSFACNMLANTLTAIDDELEVSVIFINNANTASDVTFDPNFTYHTVVPLPGFGTLIFQDHLPNNQEIPTCNTSFVNGGNWAGILASLKGTFIAPQAAPAARTDCVLWGIGLTFGLDQNFEDTYNELESNDPYVGPGTGGFGRKFMAARTNAGLDSTTVPSGFGPNLNGFQVESYRDGQFTQYQNGHPNQALRGVDNRSFPIYNNTTVYTVGTRVNHKTKLSGGNADGLDYTCLVTNGPGTAAGIQEPDQGSTGLGTTWWAPYGTYWNSVAAGVYDDLILAWWEQIRLAKDGFNTNLWRQNNPFFWCFSHEFSNGGDTMPNGPGAGVPADYIPAFRHCYNLMFAANNANSRDYHYSRPGGFMANCYIPEWKQVCGDPAWGVAGHLFVPSNGNYIVSNMWPGNSYIDFMGADIYSHTTSHLYQYQWPVIQAWAYANGRPFVAPECGCDAANGDTFCVNYWQSLVNDLQSGVNGWGPGVGPGNLHFMCVTARIAGGGDYRMNATQPIYNQFLTMSQMGLFGAASSPMITGILSNLQGSSILENAHYPRVIESEHYSPTFRGRG